MKIRKATVKDFNKLYYFADKIPELKVNIHEPFMTKAEFRFAIKNPHGIFLLAEEDKKIIGFTYANIRDKGEFKTACLVYLAVHPKYRNKGIGYLLHKKREKLLKKQGVTHVYGWVGANNKEIQRFSKKLGMKPGKKFIWFEKSI